MKKALACSLAMILFIALLSPFALALAQEQSCKITKQLQEEMQKLSDDEELMVYIVTTDVDYDATMELFQLNSPELYEVYRYAKEEDIAASLRELYYANNCVDNDASIIDDSVDPEALQSAIERKRELFAEEYYTKNKCFIDGYLTDDKQIYVSHYSPLMIASLSKSMINNIIKDSSVIYLDICKEEPIIEYLTGANVATHANYVRDSLGYDVSGIKIGQVEPTEPNHSVLSLSTANIIHSTDNPVFGNHATDVATVLVGNSNNYKGVVPGATLYSCSAPDDIDFIPSCEWLIDQGVNIIVASMGVPSNAGYYNTISEWTDHIAVYHDIHFVVAAGNEESNIAHGPLYVGTPGMAYNAITVGAFDDKNDPLNTVGFEMYSESRYVESIPYGRPEKPNLIAPGVNMHINGRTESGTSFAAPQVAGVAAQLCQIIPSLKTRQTELGAIITAGCIIKIDDTPNTGLQGTQYLTHINGSSQINDMEGAGILNAKTSRQCAVNGKHWRYTINKSNFPFTQNVYISSVNNSLIRVAIFWLRRNSLTGTHLDGHGVSAIDFTNLDLKVKAPDGTVVGTSTTAYSNFEIVQFVPTQAGYYQIVITRNGSSDSTKEYVGIAVW